MTDVISMTNVRELDLVDLAPLGGTAAEWPGFMASMLVLELEKLGHQVEAAFPNDQAKQVAAELEQLAAEVTGREQGSVRVTRQPHRPGWTRLGLCAVGSALR
jgi:hypothetical protein